MKRNLLISVFILLALAGVAAWLAMGHTTSTLPVDDADFAVADTGAVDRIVMSDRNKNQVVLRRATCGQWLANEQLADQRRVALVLETIKQMGVKSPVPPAARENVIRDMATTALEVQVFKGDKKLKHFYVGGTTPDELGTLMYIKNAKDPFVVHIPGFNGYLSSRFYIDAQEWRSQLLFRFSPGQIREVNVHFPQYRENDFSVKSDNNNFLMAGGLKPSDFAPIKSVEAKQYLVGFSKQYAEGFKNYEPREVDSIAAMPPQAIINIKLDNGQAHSLALYSMATSGRSKNMDLNDPYDVDRLLGVMDKDFGTIYLLQWQNIEKLLAKP